MMMTCLIGDVVLSSFLPCGVLTFGSETWVGGAALVLTGFSPWNIATARAAVLTSGKAASPATLLRRNALKERRLDCIGILPYGSRIDDCRHPSLVAAIHEWASSVSGP